jgi:hypothetical protein
MVVEQTACEKETGLRKPEQISIVNSNRGLIFKRASFIYFL